MADRRSVVAVFVIFSGRGNRAKKKLPSDPGKKRFGKIIFFEDFFFFHACKNFVIVSRYISGTLTLQKHTFSAFWLRSSVVSVLISLISDTALPEQRY